MNTVSQIQSAINSKKPISFWYSYSHPDTERVVEPMSLANGSLVARENGNIKRFNIDGINLISSEKNDTIKTIDEMINANATMVFTYSLSQPEKVRYASPIEIKGDLVIAVEADTGKYKCFKLEGINFINENREMPQGHSKVEEEGEIVEDKEIVSEYEEQKTSIRGMIVQAITFLRYRGGCSRPAIRKYIIDNFNISPYTVDRKLNIALKRGVDSGVLIQKGQHFKVNKAKKNVKLEDSATTGIFIPSTQTPEQRIQNLVQKHIDYKEPMTFKYSFSNPDLVRTFYPESIKNYIVTGKENGKYKSFALTGIMNVQEVSLQEVSSQEVTSFHENMVMRERFTLKNGKIEGLYQSWCENGQKRAECTYLDGKLEGLCKVWDNEGNLNECHYKNGELVEAPTNEKVEWHENGAIKAKYTLKNGKKEGLYREWWKNGKKCVECNFKDGEKDGLFKCFWNEGQKQIECTFKDGKKDGLFRSWFEKGQKWIDCYYRNDKKEGLYQQWWDNGQKWIESSYREGREDGLCKAWNKEGKKVNELYYKNGELVEPSEAPTVPCSPSGVDEPTLPQVKVTLNTNDFIFQKVEEEANMDIYDDYGMLKLTRRDAFVKKPKNYKGLIGRRIRIELPYDIKEDVYVFNVVDEIAYVEFPNGEQIRLDMNETPYKVLPRSNEYMHFKKLENKTISFVHTRLNIPVKITISEIEEMYVEDVIVVRGIVNGKEVVILSDEIENFKIEV